MTAGHHHRIIMATRTDINRKGEKTSDDNRKGHEVLSVWWPNVWYGRGIGGWNACGIAPKFSRVLPPRRSSTLLVSQSWRLINAVSYLGYTIIQWALQKHVPGIYVFSYWPRIPQALESGGSNHGIDVFFSQMAPAVKSACCGVAIYDRLSRTRA